MSTYKVKLGEKTLDVDGVDGLIRLVDGGQLGPDDPVFIPSTGRWHYARSIRQLREHFPPSPPPRTPIPTPARPPSPSPPRATPAKSAIAPVVPLRPPKATAPEPTSEASPSVPVFSYDVDAATRLPLSFRVIALSIFGVIVLALAWVYLSGYRQYILNEALAPTPPASQARLAPVTPLASAPTPMRTPSSAARTATPKPTPTPVPPPSFDAKGALGKVLGLSLTPVARPDQLGPAIKKDLIRLAVPVSAVVVAEGRGARNQAVPFFLTVDYAPGSIARDDRAKQEWMIAAMLGRRISDLKLNVARIEVQVPGRAGRKPERVSLTADLARRVALGQATPAEVDALFRE